MKATTTYKVPNGKLIKLFLEFDQKKNTIDSIAITGDFFVYPEEAMMDLEAYLQGQKLQESLLTASITTFVTSHQIELIGISPEAVSKAIMMCVS